MQKPTISQDPMYQMLRDENVAGFNAEKAAGKPCDLRGCDFRGLDLRGLDAGDLDLTDAYFRGADLRGIDFRTSKLHGASLVSANISGCYFPDELKADEIVMSLTQGTRLRYS